MKWISPLLTRQKAFRTSLVLVGISVACFLLPVDAKTYISGKLITAYAPFYGISNKIDDAFEVYDINRQLRTTITGQMLELTVLREQERENDRLRELLGFKESVEYDLIPAEIIALDPKRRQNAVIAEIGHDAQVAVDLPVVNVDGLVGKTTSVLGDLVTVELLTSPNCRAAARDANTRVLGIVRWTGGKRLLLDNVSISDTVAVGDTVITSGLGGVFPEGLLVGTIISVVTGESPFFKSITLEPFVDFGALEELIVLKKSGGL